MTGEYDDDIEWLRAQQEATEPPVWDMPEYEPWGDERDDIVRDTIMSGNGGSSWTPLATYVINGSNDDQEVRDDGSMQWIGQAYHRIGGNTNKTDAASIFVMSAGGSRPDCASRIRSLWTDSARST